MTPLVSEAKKKILHALNYAAVYFHEKALSDVACFFHVSRGESRNFGRLCRRTNQNAESHWCITH